MHGKHVYSLQVSTITQAHFHILTTYNMLTRPCTPYNVIGHCQTTVFFALPLHHLHVLACLALLIMFLTQIVFACLCTQVSDVYEVSMCPMLLICICSRMCCNHLRFACLINVVHLHARPCSPHMTKLLNSSLLLLVLLI